MPEDNFFKKGWATFAFDPAIFDWVQQTLPVARQAIHNPDYHHWLRCGGTWFAGVNVLPNNQYGQINHGPKLTGNVIDFIKQNLNINQPDWDAGQLSVCYPGYPKPSRQESQANFNYRLKRDAAHLDGLLPEGKHRRRHLREHHAFILGLPLVETSNNAAPLVVWEGSHEIIRKTFVNAFASIPSHAWGDIDMTDIYQSMRRDIFKQCKRAVVWARPGESYLIHRLTLHGVSSWSDSAVASDDGRMIVYFRPELSSAQRWLDER